MNLSLNTVSDGQPLQYILVASSSLIPPPYHIILSFDLEKTQSKQQPQTLYRYLISLSNLPTTHSTHLPQSCF